MTKPIFPAVGEDGHIRDDHLPDRLSEDSLSTTFEPKAHERGTERRIYVRADGSDESGDGSWHTPYRQISTAINFLADDGPVIRGSVIIDVGAGTYEGGIRVPITRGVAQDDFIKIIGRQDADGVPTAHIDVTSGAGLLVEDGSALWLEDIKFVGNFSAAIQATRNVYLWCTNLHIDGQGKGARGMSISAHCRYYVKGGVIENCTYAGIDEYFLVSRSYATVSSSADQMVIRNCQIGLRAKEGCVGHLDYLQVEDCETGVELIQNSVANFKGVELRRNGVGLALVNSTSHNEGGMVWGNGPDANDRDTYSAGMSGELRAMMWSGEEMARTASTGHRPLMLIGNDYTPRTITGAAGAETRVVNFSQTLPRAFFRTAGKHFKAQILARFTGATENSHIRVSAKIGTVLLGYVDVREDGMLMAEFDTVCVEDGAHHLTRSTLIGSAVQSQEARRSNTALAGVSSAVSSLELTVTPSAEGQSVRVESAEMWG